MSRLKLIAPAFVVLIAASSAHAGDFFVRYNPVTGYAFIAASNSDTFALDDRLSETYQDIITSRDIEVVISVSSRTMSEKKLDCFAQNYVDLIGVETVYQTGSDQYGQWILFDEGATSGLIRPLRSGDRCVVLSMGYPTANSEK